MFPRGETTGRIILGIVLSLELLQSEVIGDVVDWVRLPLPPPGLTLLYPVGDDSLRIIILQSVVESAESPVGLSSRPAGSVWKGLSGVQFLLEPLLLSNSDAAAAAE